MTPQTEKLKSDPSSFPAKDFSRFFDNAIHILQSLYHRFPHQNPETEASFINRAIDAIRTSNAQERLAKLQSLLSELKAKAKSEGIDLNSDYLTDVSD